MKKLKLTKEMLVSLVYLDVFRVVLLVVISPILPSSLPTYFMSDIILIGVHNLAPTRFQKSPNVAEFNH